MNWSKYISCEHLGRKIQFLGPVPSTKEAYQTALRIAWPSATETVLVSLVSSVDVMMVGSLGHQAIAAVGLTNQPKFLLLALINSLNVGVTTVVARRRGQENREGAQKCLRSALMISACLSLVLSMIGYTFAEPIMAFSGAQADSMEYAVEYFRIIMIGFMPMCVGLTVNAAQRGVGNTRIAMTTNLTSNFINLIFNYLLIQGNLGFPRLEVKGAANAAQRGVGNTRIAMTTNLTSNFINLIFNYLLIQGNLGFPRLEVKGAAIATILGSTVACLLSIRSLLPHDTYLHLNLRTGWKPDKESLRSIWGISYSALIEQVFMRIGFFTYVKIVANLGTMAFATHQICMNIINLSMRLEMGSALRLHHWSVSRWEPNVPIWQSCMSR